MLAIALFTAALYWPARLCGVLSDAWHLLYIGSRPLGEAVATRLSYHFIPVTHLLDAILWRLLGSRDSLYQLVNLGELAAVAGALYFTGRRLFPQPLVAILAAFLFVANASHYEVPMWTGVGNFQSLAALLYLAGLACALRAGGSPRAAQRALWSGLFAFCGLAAFFTYEPAFSLLPVGVVAAVTADHPAGMAAWRSRLRRAVIPAAAASAAVAIVLAVKAHLAAAGDPPLFLPQTLFDLLVRCLYLVRGLIGLFTLRAHGHFVQRVTQLGLPYDLGHPAFHALLVGWLVVFGAVALLLMWRGSAGLRLAAFWIVAHLALVSAAIIPQSRHLYLAALPAALISAALLAAGAERLAGAARRHLGEWAAQPGFLALVALLILVPGAKADLDRAAALFGAGTEATRGIRAEVQQRLGEMPPLTTVNLVNLPSQVAGDGVSAYFFVNGMREMVELSTGGAIVRDQVKLYQVHSADHPERFANGSAPTSLVALDAAARDLATLTLLYDPASKSVHRLRPTAWRLPSEITPETVFMLPWVHSGEPYLELTAERALELPLSFQATGSWIAVRFLRFDGGGLRLKWRDRALSLDPRPVAAPYWSTMAFDAGDAASPLQLAVEGSAGSRLAGIWSFLPPSSYTVQTAPFLTWWQWDSLMMVVQEPVTLPVATAGCRPSCQLRLEYQPTPGMELTVSIDDGPPRELGTGAPIAWAEASVPLPGDQAVHRVTLTPLGSQARLRTLAVVTAPDTTAEPPL